MQLEIPTMNPNPLMAAVELADAHPIPMPRRARKS
jgi:hypothetical protein